MLARLLGQPLGLVLGRASAGAHRDLHALVAELRPHAGLEPVVIKMLFHRRFKPQWLLISRYVLGPEQLYQRLPLDVGLCAGVEGGLEQLLPGERLQGGCGGEEGKQQQHHGDSDPQQDTDTVSLFSLFTQAYFICPYPGQL